MTTLTAREREIMGCVARGLTNREIAAELYIAPKTARNHVSAILAKLNARNRTDAAVKFRGLSPART